MVFMTKFTKTFNTLYDICNQWKLEFNVQKTKTAAFKNGGKLRNTENSLYNDYHIDVISEFNYLGLLMSSKGKCLKLRKMLVIRETGIF